MQPKRAYTIQKSTLVQLIIGGLATLLSLYVVYEVQMVICLLEKSEQTPQSLLWNTEKENTVSESTTYVLDDPKRN